MKGTNGPNLNRDGPTHRASRVDLADDESPSRGSSVEEGRQRWSREVQSRLVTPPGATGVTGAPTACFLVALAAEGNVFSRITSHEPPYPSGKAIKTCRHAFPVILLILLNSVDQTDCLCAP